MRVTARTVVGIAAVAAVRTVKAADTDDYDPIQDFCKRFSAGSAVIRERLYIDGGLVTIQSDKGTNFTNKNLLYHDLSTTKNADGSEISLPPLVADKSSKSAKVPSVVGGTIWADSLNGYLYSYGGQFEDGTKPGDYEMWVYDAFGDSWSTVETKSGINRLSYGAATTVDWGYDRFYMGGYLDAKNTPDWTGDTMAVNSLLQYTVDKNTWANTTAPNDNNGRAEGALFTVPVGDGGLLVYFGGIWAPDGDVSNAEASPMEWIDIYDLANNKWYTQNATGDIPETRRRFCGGITWPEDKSSFEIYIFGGLGFGNNETAAYNDVYALSLPAFEWTRLNSYDTGGKYDATCNVVNNGSQMIVIGGQTPGSDACDVFDDGAAGAHSMDLGKRKVNSYWAGYNSSLFGYEVPDNITDIIGGTSDGGATATEPEDGWSNPDLGTQFSRVLHTPSLEATRAVPEAFGGPANSGLSTGAIVGIVIGSVVGVAIILGAAFFFWRRRRQQKSASEKKHEGENGEAGATGRKGEQNYQTVPGGSPGAEEYGPSSPTFAAPPSYHDQADSSLPRTLMDPVTGRFYVANVGESPQRGYPQVQEAFELSQESETGAVQGVSEAGSSSVPSKPVAEAEGDQGVNDMGPHEMMTDLQRGKSLRTPAAKSAGTSAGPIEGPSA